MLLNHQLLLKINKSPIFKMTLSSWKLRWLCHHENKLALQIKNILTIKRICPWIIYIGSLKFYESNYVFPHSIKAQIMLDPTTYSLISTMEGWYFVNSPHPLLSNSKRQYSGIFSLPVYLLSILMVQELP